MTPKNYPPHIVDEGASYQQKVEEAPYHPGYEDAVITPRSNPVYVGMDPAKMIWKSKPLSDGVILNSIQHPRNDGYVPEELNSDSLEMVEINLPCSLTIDEIHNLFGITALNPTVTLTWEQCEKIARAIEERHGIK